MPPPSPRIFGLTFDLVHSVVRESWRGCTLQGAIEPTGSSGLADDTSLHTDGPDAVRAMAKLVTKTADYLQWAGMDIHLKKCGSTAMDMRNGQRVATDSITLRGQPFPVRVILLNQSHKHLGVRMAIDGNFLAEKEHVHSDMEQRLNALAEDRALIQKEKERVLITAVCLVFSYSAGFVDWTKAELDRISKMWTRAYKQEWTISSSTDSSPLIPGQPDGGRGCPLASIMLTREALEVIEQCVSLPGETSQIVRHYLRQQCISRGCKTLNQLQQISGRAKSVLELLLLRLDEQGLDIYSPWRISGGDLIGSVLWPKLYAAWLSKEQWAGCREVDEDLRKAWEQAQLCLAACASLGSAEPAILLISQIRGIQTQWLRLDELANRHCHLSPVEHTALTSWLSLLGTQQFERSAAASRPSEVTEVWSEFSDILPQRCSWKR